MPLSRSSSGPKESQKKIRLLKPIQIQLKDFSDIEERIKKAFVDQIYKPLLDLLPKGLVVQNAKPNLGSAIASGRLIFRRGAFYGSFSAQASKELKKLGARWDRKSESFRIPFAELPAETRSAIEASEARFVVNLKSIDDRLAEIQPNEIVDGLRFTKSFDRALWRTNSDLHKTMDSITVVPKLTKSRAERISQEWQENMDLWIKDFTREEIVRLRRSIQKSAFSGNRYEAVTKAIQRSYGVSMNKAKFLARQETNLLLTTFRETRYQEAGIHEYIWRCVAGSKAHPVRPAHKRLDGKKFRFDKPPVTTEPGQPQRRNNPGKDFGCRCSAVPVVRI